MSTSSQPIEASPTRSLLVIDDDEVLLEYYKACLTNEMPEVEVTTYDSRRLGRPAADFDWGAHDLLLLDYNLGYGETGLDWMRSYSSKPGFPPTIVISAETSPKLVGNAVHRGAVGFLNKAELKPGKLVDAVRDFFEQADAEAGKPAPRPDSDSVFPRSDENVEGGGANYRFIKQIGRGAMSRVFLAERVEDGATMVLKILARDVARDPENVQRFAQEGELIARVNSPYVVRIYDHGTTNSYGYIAMEFFGRGDLAQRMEQGVSPDDAVVYLHNIACGLDAIHRANIVHRDLKPGNIMFRGDGSMALVDFGLSKRIGLDMSLTETGVILGTPYCMSPEQTRGVEVDHRADIYAAGVMFYEMLTGERPFVGANLPALLLAIQRAPVPTLPEELARYQTVVDRLLAKDPGERYQSAAEVLLALEPLAPAA